MQQKLFKIRDKRQKGWFYLDNEYLNGLGKEMGPIGIAVYVSLCRHADQDQKCFPAQQTIAEEIGVGTRTVVNYLGRLEERNVIRKKRERTNDGKWLNNVYYLIDKTEWVYPSARDADGKPSANKDKAKCRKMQSQVHQMHTNNTNKKYTNSNNTNIATQSVAGKDINNLIDLFESVNPTHNRLFKNKTQRKAIEDLVKKWGKDKIEWIIKVIPKTNEMKYAPTITTPIQLADKLGNLVAFIKKSKIKNKPTIAKIK
jgi:hypothetical protein